MEGGEADSEPATAGSTPETTPTEQRKVSLADVKRRLEAEKKRIANLRKNRTKSSGSRSPKAPAPTLKRRAERRSVGEVEAKRKKVVTPPKASTSSSPEATTRKKGVKANNKAVPEPEPEEVEEEEIKEKAPVEDTETMETGPEEEAADSLPAVTDKSTALADKTEDGETGLPSDTEYVIGYKLEAKDFNQDWFPARVVEVDYDDREVLVHFERWSSRYDEWISMDSVRLRPPGPMSNVSTPVKTTKSAPKPKVPAPPPPPPVQVSAPTPPAVEKVCRKFKKDESVMASWSDSRKYPATVTEVLGNDMYKVLFFDGFTKAIKGNRITPARPGAQMESTNLAPPPPLPTTLYPADEDIGSKADRRERKRKHTVTELFSLKPRSSVGPKTPVGTSGTPAKSSPSKTTPSSSAKSASASSAKSSPATTSKSSEGSTPAKRGKAKAQTPKLQNPGQEDLMLIKSLSGAGMESGSKSKSRSPAVATDTRRVRTLLPRARNDDSPVAEPPPPHNPCTRSVDAAPPAQPPPASILEGMQIEMEGDNFKCPNKDCGKLYRKENLLQMHIKHYHPELKSLLVVVPKVLDLAYARTVGDLPSTAVMPRSSHASASVSSTATSTTAPAVRKSFTPQIVLKKPTKVTEKPEKSEKTEKQATVEEKEKVTPSTSVTEEKKMPVSLPPPPPVSSSPAKTGHIKTLLPVHRSPLKHSEGGREDAAKDKPPQAPLSALQQALMSPPGHLAAQMLHHSIHDTKSRTPVKSEAKPHFVSPHRSVGGSSRGRAKEDKSPNKELVNCMCGIPDEDGLMIQCDLCMCWQHGACNMIETDDQVPDKYVCHICLHPARQRISRKYAHDQDWLKEGVLPRMPIRRNQARTVKTNTENILKESHDITAAIIRLQEVIHSLRVKINIAEKADHPKLYLWSKRWEDDIEVPKTEDVKPVVDTKSISEEASGSASMEKPAEMTDISLSQDVDKPCSQGSEEADLHPALKLPLSQSELEHLASSVENKLRATEESSAVVMPSPAPSTPVKAPEPEAAIQPAACRLVLLEHIERLQAKLEARLSELEAQAEELEARDTEFCEPEGGSPRTKETLRLLQRDLASVTKISNYANSD